MKTSTNQKPVFHDAKIRHVCHILLDVSHSVLGICTERDRLKFRYFVTECLVLCVIPNISRIVLDVRYIVSDIVSDV